MTKYPRQKRYAATPKGCYMRHKVHARQRGVVFELTFDEWWAIWALSGRWRERGRVAGKYVMCRRGDEGPYAVGNVYIGLFEHNFKDAQAKSVRRRHTARSTTVTFSD